MRCDIVQIVAGFPAWVLPVVGCDKPIVLQVATLTKVERVARDKKPKSLLSYWRQLMTQITARYDEAGLRAADAIMVENPWMLKYALAAGGSETIVRYAPPGVNMEIFSPFDARLSRDESDNYILAVGRFSDPRKNATLLLEAYSRVRDLVSQPPPLLIAASDDLGGPFWAKVETLGLTGHVQFCLRPNDEALADLYRNALCSVLTSDEEGFGMVVIEAMSSGIPVVATRCGGPDAIITNGEDGFLVDTGDAAALADRLALLLHDREINERMGRNARNTVEKRYSEQVAGKAFLEVYHALLTAYRRKAQKNSCAA